MPKNRKRSRAMKLRWARMRHSVISPTSRPPETMEDELSLPSSPRPQVGGGLLPPSSAEAEIPETEEGELGYMDAASGTNTEGSQEDPNPVSSTYEGQQQ